MDKDKQKAKNETTRGKKNTFRERNLERNKNVYGALYRTYLCVPVTMLSGTLLDSDWPAVSNTEQKEEQGTSKRT